MFGSDPQICDVFLGERGAGFSGRQFCITFNERGEVIFKNTSRIKSFVDYNGEDPSGRNQFTWILFATYKNIQITMGDLIFKVKWSENRDSCRAEYEAHRDAYFEERRNALPSLSQLDMESQQTTAGITARHSLTQYSPRQEPLRQKLFEQKSIYLSKEELGRDGFNTIHKVIDISTSDVYTGKEFYYGN